MLRLEQRFETEVLVLDLSKLFHLVSTTVPIKNSRNSIEWELNLIRDLIKLTRVRFSVESGYSRGNSRGLLQLDLTRFTLEREAKV